MLHPMVAVVVILCANFKYEIVPPLTEFDPITLSATISNRISCTFQPFGGLGGRDAHIRFVAAADQGVSAP